MPFAAQFTIGDSIIGPGHPCYVIAEIGSNHDGRLDQALRLMETAKECGADAVKFQLFSADGLVAKRLKNDRGKMLPNPVHPILEKLTLPLEWLPKLWREAEGLGVELLATPFDTERLVAWVEQGARAIKIASGDLTHGPLLHAAAATGLPILLACGMSTQDEVAEAFSILEKSGETKVALLHCVSRYPPDDDELNLRVLPALHRDFAVPVGLSDHGPGSTAVLGSVALGACVIEKHFTLDRKLPGPDHPFAMEPAELARMIKEIRRLEKMLGDGIKKPTPAEVPEQLVGRRSIVAAKTLKAGRTLAREHLKCVRPGGGIPPTQLDQLIGKQLLRDLREDEMIARKDVGGVMNDE